MKNKISIIGFGNFGQFMAKSLKEFLEVNVTDKIEKTEESKNLGVKFVSLEESCKNKIIILAIPMEDLEEILNRIKNKLIPGTLVLDVCSLKMFSCSLMKKILPRNIQIIGTHPLFGPHSVKGSLNGMRIALVNVHATNKIFNEVQRFCENIGLKIIITTPEEHDKQMAISQALTHFIGQVCKKINLQRIEMSTKTFNDLMNIVDIIKNDTPKLFNNMQTMNPFSKNIRNKFILASKKLNNQLNSESGRRKNV